MKTQNKTQHTQGEWSVSVQGDDVFIRPENIMKRAICKIYPREDENETAEANAERIVKCVNMHDELVETLRKLEMGLNNIASERTSTWNKYEPIIAKAKQLLKQAEQK